MADAATELDAFYAFGRERLAQGGDWSLDDLLLAWDSERDRDEINAAIREGIADVDAGRTRPLLEAVDEIRARYGIERE